MNDLDQFTKEVEYIADDLADGPWYERVYGRLLRWYWRRRLPSVRLMSVDDQRRVLYQMGYRGGFLR